MSETDPPYFLLPRERALQEAIGNMLDRGIGKFRFVPRPNGFAVVRPAPPDVPLDEVLLEETVFTSDVCDYATIEQHYAEGGISRWGHAFLLEVRVERHPRQITFELYVRLERARGDTPASGRPQEAG